MSDRPQSAIIERIRKLLSRTEAAGATPAEAEAAFAMASRLMAEHNLDSATVDAAGDGSGQEFIEATGYEYGKKWTLPQSLAYGIVKEFFFVEGITSNRLDEKTGRYGRKLSFFGTRSNVEAAQFVYPALMAAFDRLFDDYRRRTGCPGSEKRLFVTGVARGFSDKLRDERRAVEIERDLISGRSGGTALALVSIAEITRQKYREANPNVKQSRSTVTGARGSASTLDAGIQAGRSLNLNRSIGSGSDRKKLG